MKRLIDAICKWWMEVPIRELITFLIMCIVLFIGITLLTFEDVPINLES